MMRVDRGGVAHPVGGAAVEVGRRLEHGRHAGRELRPDGCADASPQVAPLDAAHLAHGHDLLGDLHVRDVAQREQVLGQG